MSRKSLSPLWGLKLTHVAASNDLRPCSMTLRSLRASQKNMYCGSSLLWHYIQLRLSTMLLLLSNCLLLTLAYKSIKSMLLPQNVLMFLYNFNEFIESIKYSSLCWLEACKDWS